MSDEISVIVLESGEIETVVLNVGPAGDDGADGAGGDSFVDSGSRVSPNLITTSIPVSSDALIRAFVKGSSGPVTNPTITHVAGNKMIKLFGTSNTDTVSIAKSTGNFELSGQWVGKSGSILLLEWDGQSKYTESYRNEI